MSSTGSTGGARQGTVDQGEPLLRAEDIVVRYHTRGSAPVHAVENVDITLRRGETLGLVGESGSGKSSLGRAIAQLPPPTSGRVRLDDMNLTAISAARLRPIRRRFQMIFQDPISSLNPRRTALEVVAEPLRIVGHPDPAGRAREVLEEVGMHGQMVHRKPHELSGGQCQRISIARAIVLEPEVLICDEPVSALDVSVQAQVLNLLERLKETYHLSMIFISHDLAVVSNVSDRIAVLYLGRLCEVAPARELYTNPHHHYTRLLLSSIPDPEGTRQRTAETVGVRRRPEHRRGCMFAPRCPAATGICASEQPPLVETGTGSRVACHHPG